MNEGKKLAITRISYARTSELDVHSYYDSRYRKKREEYYSLDGMPDVTAIGYFVREYDYDDYENNSVVRIYGSDNQLFRCKDSQAITLRTFNPKRQIIRV